MTVATDGTRPERCETCRFWEADTDSVGDCHRLPPQMVRSDQTFFPSTAFDDWCGEWRAKEGVVDWRTLTLEEGKMPQRVQTILEREGVRTLGELVAYSEYGLLALPHFGFTLLRQVRETLGKHGAKLKGDV